MGGWNPATWVSLIPNGMGFVKPNHAWETLETLWENRDEIPFAWRILSDGVCDGCALGTTGMRDFTLKGLHLCTVRLHLLRLNTMGSLDIRCLTDVSSLKGKSSKELRNLGRLPYPMIRKRGDPGFTRIAWDEAFRLLGDRIRGCDPKRIAFFQTSRGITNEVYYVVQKVARFLGTNHVDNSARICHSPSTVALKQTIGVPASTCSYRDWIGSDLLIFIGSDVPNNQPVTTKYLYYAKREGTKIVVVNPYREPGLERYWVPSVLESALFGTKLADRFFLIRTGGDIAFFSGVLKGLIEIEKVDQEFIGAHTTGFDELAAGLAATPWELLERHSGTSRAEMEALARLYGEARSAVFIWSMGVTQHAFGVENVKSIVNLVLARGMVGKTKCGLMPIRGHSGVQGSSEMGAVPNTLPGSVSLADERERARLEDLWGFPIPAWQGYSAPQMVDAAHAGTLDLLWMAGGNFLETLPDPAYVRRALEQVPFRVHQDIVLSSQMLLDPNEVALLLPAATRYEQRGGGTETSTERRIYFSPEIPGRRIGEAMAEWEIYLRAAQSAYPGKQSLIEFPDAAAIRAEIARAVPFYDGIQHLSRKGDAVQWGGPLLCEGGQFPTKDGKARFSVVSPPTADLPEGRFLLSTRRGKQFNSMVQKERDPLTGASRDDVLMAPDDMATLGLSDGSAVLLRSPKGELRGRAKGAPILPGNVQVHWPEGNILLSAVERDPECDVPDYNACVEVIPLPAGREPPT